APVHAKRPIDKSIGVLECCKSAEEAAAVLDEVQLSSFLRHTFEATKPSVRSALLNNLPPECVRWLHEQRIRRANEKLRRNNLPKVFCIATAISGKNEEPLFVALSFA